MVHKKDYPVIEANNCARFMYRGKPRVVRVIEVTDSLIKGYETKRGGKIVNKRYAPIKSFRLDRIRGGLSLSRR